MGIAHPAERVGRVAEQHPIAGELGHHVRMVLQASAVHDGVVREAARHLEDLGGRVSAPARPQRMRLAEALLIEVAEVVDGDDLAPARTADSARARVVRPAIRIRTGARSRAAPRRRPPRGGGRAPSRGSREGASPRRRAVPPAGEAVGDQRRALRRFLDARGEAVDGSHRQCPAPGAARERDDRRHPAHAPESSTSRAPGAATRSAATSFAAASIRASQATRARASWTARAARSSGGRSGIARDEGRPAREQGRLPHPAEGVRDLAVERPERAVAQSAGAAADPVHDSPVLDAERGREEATQLEEHERGVLRREAEATALVPDAEGGDAHLVGGAHVHAVHLPVSRDRVEVDDAGQEDGGQTAVPHQLHHRPEPADALRLVPVLGPDRGPPDRAASGPARRRGPAGGRSRRARRSGRAGAPPPADPPSAAGARRASSAPIDASRNTSPSARPQRSKLCVPGSTPTTRGIRPGAAPGTAMLPIACPESQPARAAP